MDAPVTPARLSRAFLLFAALLGLIVASWPARLDVLTAIAAQ